MCISMSTINKKWPQTPIFITTPSLLKLSNCTMHMHNDSTLGLCLCVWLWGGIVVSQTTTKTGTNLAHTEAKSATHGKLWIAWNLPIPSIVCKNWCRSITRHNQYPLCLRVISVLCAMASFFVLSSVWFVEICWDSYNSQWKKYLSCSFLYRCLPASRGAPRMWAWWWLPLSSSFNCNRPFSSGPVNCWSSSDEEGRRWAVGFLQLNSICITHS